MYVLGTTRLPGPDVSHLELAVLRPIVTWLLWIKSYLPLHPLGCRRREGCASPLRQVVEHRHSSHRLNKQKYQILTHLMLELKSETLGVNKTSQTDQ